jgi:hypothetical protein
MSITSRNLVTVGRLRRQAAARALGRIALAFSVLALVGAVALTATAGASGGGCTRNGTGPINSCVQVDGSGLYAIDMRASVQVDANMDVVGRLHLFGPAGFSLVKDFSYRSPSWHLGQYAWTWGVDREVRAGAYCAQFEIDTWSGWRRDGNGPACLTVHP